MPKQVKARCKNCGWIGPDRSGTKDPVLFADSDLRYHAQRTCPKTGADNRYPASGLKKSSAKTRKR